MAYWTEKLDFPDFHARIRKIDLCLYFYWIFCYPGGWGMALLWKVMAMKYKIALALALGVFVSSATGAVRSILSSGDSLPSGDTVLDVTPVYNDWLIENRDSLNDRGSIVILAKVQRSNGEVNDELLSYLHYDGQDWEQLLTQQQRRINYQFEDFGFAFADRTRAMLLSPRHDIFSIYANALEGYTNPVQAAFVLHVTDGVINKVFSADQPFTFPDQDPIALASVFALSAPRADGSIVGLGQLVSTDGGMTAGLEGLFSASRDAVTAFLVQDAISVSNVIQPPLVNDAGDMLYCASNGGVQSTHMIYAQADVPFENLESLVLRADPANASLPDAMHCPQRLDEEGRFAMLVKSNGSQAFDAINRVSDGIESTVISAGMSLPSPDNAMSYVSFEQALVDDGGNVVFSAVLNDSSLGLFKWRSAHSDIVKILREQNARTDQPTITVIDWYRLTGRGQVVVGGQSDSGNGVYLATENRIAMLAGDSDTVGGHVVTGMVPQAVNATGQALFTVGDAPAQTLAVVDVDNLELIHNGDQPELWSQPESWDLTVVPNSLRDVVLNSPETITEYPVSLDSAKPIFAQSLVLNGDGLQFVVVDKQMTIAENFLIASGATFSNNRSQIRAQTVEVNGALAGSGTFVAEVNVNHKIVPGATYGTIRITGTLTLQESSIYEVQIGDEAPKSKIDNYTSDAIDVSGTAKLGGSLNVSFGGSTDNTLPLGTTYIIMQADTLEGEFSQIYLPALTADPLRLNYGSKDHRAAVVLVVGTANRPLVASPAEHDLIVSPTLTGFLPAFDEDYDRLEYVVTAGPLGGDFEYDSATGEYTYTNTEHVPRKTAITFHVNDGTVNSNSARIIINVIGPGGNGNQQSGGPNPNPSPGTNTGSASSGSSASIDEFVIGLMLLLLWRRRIILRG